MSNLQSKIVGVKGFMAIVALGIFALLMVFGLIVQMTVVDTYRNVKSSNNYLAARVVADSVMEFLQLKLDDSVGLNTPSGIVCKSTGERSGEATTGGNLANPSVWCDGLAWATDGSGRDVEIALEIKGRADKETEKISTSRCGTNSITNCYVIPFPGTGDAGGRCNMYTPKFNSAATEDRQIKTSLSNGLTLDQLDYPCNWNKLTFGSSLTDRVAIPLYYNDDVGEVVNPYAEGATDPATQLILRMRTPCLPCVYATSDVKTGENRYCKRDADPKVCADPERYVLETAKDNKIVVQWQLSGKCTEEGSEEEKDCSMIADPSILNTNSAIFEARINDAKDNTSKKYIITDNQSTGTNISVHPTEDVSFLNDLVSPFLPVISKPILNIFLSNALISNKERNIPYLEYQLLADQPFANPKTKMEVEVTVDGNTFKRTLYKEVRKELIDFAIQN